MILLGVVLGSFYAWLLRREWPLLTLVGAAGWLAYAYLTDGWPRLGLGFVLVIWLLFGGLFLRNRSRYLLLAYFALFYLSFLTTLRGFSPRLQEVWYRTAGNDPLTYESHARAILEGWSLEGGESVFYWQPLFRYILFTEHLLLGDGDPFILIAGLTALNWAVFWMASRLWGPRRRPLAARVLFVLGGLLLLALANSAPVIANFHDGLPDHPTWVALPLFLTMLLAARSKRWWLAGTAFLGATVLTRTNQAVALAAVFLLFFWRAYQLERRRALLAATFLGLIALLPAGHNLYYGERLVVMPTSAGLPVNLVLPPTRLLAGLHDPGIRAAVWNQIRSTLHFPGPPDPGLAVVLRGLQIAWLAAVVWILAWGRSSRDSALLLSVPLLYLGVHLFYVADLRHTLAGYFAAGAVVMYAAGTARTPAATR